MSQTTYKHPLLRRAVLLAIYGLPATALPALGASLPVHTALTPHTKFADVPVSGRVVDNRGEGIPGVTVLVKGTTLGASTDVQGRFSLNVPLNGTATLVFSNVGFRSQEIPVTGATTTLNVTLQESAQELSDVVVVGYGTQERGSVTGAVSSVSGREVAAQPVADANQAIQGRAAGVTVVQNSGAPGGGAGTSIRVRGVTSAGNNNPLYVVDGFPLPTGSDQNSGLSSINPNDIETIDVLKDASATAIYGVRAANGVVLITTKRGKNGVSSINLDAYIGTQSVWRKQDLLNSQQYATLNNENRNNYNAQFPTTPIQLNERFNTPEKIAALGTTNWQDAIYRNAKIQNYNLSATGGSEKARYALSAGYFQQDGTLINSSFERFSFRGNGDLQLNKILKVGNSLTLTHTQERPLDTNNDYASPVTYALSAPPTRPVYDPTTGLLTEFSTATDFYLETNPVTETLRRVNKNIGNRVLGTLFAEIEPVKGLRYRINVGTDLQFNQQSSFTLAIPGSTRLQQASLNSSQYNNASYLIENTLTYDRVFGDKHSVSFLLGQSNQQFDYTSLSASRNNYATNNLQVLDAGPQNGLGNSGNLGQSRLASYFARVNYEFSGKYLLSAIIRSDGSSQFAPGQRFGYFPGASAGWRISEEEFLKGNKVISNLKLRGGWGKVGNPANAGSYAYLQTISQGNIAGNANALQYVFGSGSQTFVTGAAPTRSASLLQWETNTQTNLGVDIGLLDNRLEASIDVYTRSSPNLIINVPVSRVSGTYEDQIVNAAASRNRGLDFTFTSRNFVGEKGAFSWTTNLNFSLYRNQLTSLGGGQPFNAQQFRGNQSVVRYDAGVPFGSFYGYVMDGIFQSNDEVSAANARAATQSGVAGTYFQQGGTAAGDIRYKDLNGDGVINDLDRTFIGNPNPSFTYGVTNTFGYKGFDLSVFLQGSQGNQTFNLNRFTTDGALYGNGNSNTRVLDHWTPTNPSNSVPRAIAGDPNNNQRFSSYYVEDGSYMRIKLLTLGYTLPKAISDKISAQRIRFYVSAQNLLTATKYKGLEPEVASVNYVNGGFQTSLGVDRGTYPQARTFIGGVNIGF